MSISRFTIFNHLWAVAGFCEWVRWRHSESGFDLGLLAASALLFIFPNSILCLAVYASFQIFFASLVASSPWNHGLIIAVMNAAILLSIARHFVTKFISSGRDRSLDREKLIGTFAPALCLSLIIVYFFTFFHKLNADFVNPEVSCAGYVLELINRSYRILPLANWAIVVSIWTTLIVEFVVPILLLFRRTVYIGLLIGSGFHLFLSQYGGLHGFAAMIFTFYFLFLPKGFTVEIDRRFRDLLGKFPWPSLHRYALVVTVCLLLVLTKMLTYFFEIRLLYVGMIYWDFWLLGVLIWFGPALLLLKNMPADFCLLPRWAPLWIIPIGTFLNGMCPYLGLKTETSWAMYSNLRTEVNPNHFLMPSAMKVFDYQDDLVEIIETSHPKLKSFTVPDVAIPLIEFRRICSSQTQDFYVSYRRNGVEGKLIVSEGISSNPELTQRLPWFQDEFLRFRPVDMGVHSTCRH